MNILQRGGMVLLIFITLGRSTFAIEVEGTVVEATDTTASIQSTSETIPNVGDPVEIYFGVAGLKAKATAASGKVREIKGKTIVVAIEKKNAKVVAGMNATMQCSPSRLLLCTLSRGNNPELVLVRDDGLEVKRLTSDPGRDVYAGWSPDGKRIVFSSDNNGRGLFLMDADGGNRKRLTSGPDEGATWSPDGKTIVFTHYIERFVTQLLAIRVDDVVEGRRAVPADDQDAPDLARQKLTDGTTYDAGAAWSPDGKMIAFDSNRSGNGWRVYLMDADGKNVRDLSQSDNPRANVFPAWSPDGKRIAYSDWAPNQTLQIFVIDVDGKNKKQLTKEGIFNTYVAWSPDGKKLAYMSYLTAKSKGSLVIMNPDGTQAKIIGPDQGAGHNGRVAWKPK
jgi:TolB protein